jgi:hypothetical protein
MLRTSNPLMSTARTNVGVMGAKWKRETSKESGSHEEHQESGGRAGGRWSPRLLTLPVPLLPLPTGAVDESCKAVEIVIGEIRCRLVQKCSDSAVRRAIEEGAQEMAHGAATGRLARNGGAVHVAWPVLLMSDVAFFFQDAEMRADGGVAGWIDEGVAYIGRAGGPEAVEGIEDFAFAATEAWWEHEGADWSVLKG